MRIEIINTGSELLLGRVLNTHQQWISQRCAELGLVVERQVTVPDTGPEIVAALREALTRSDFILITGGLGPTSDDLTRNCIADFLHKRLQEDPVVLKNIEGFFQRRRRPMPSSTRVQALIPEGAIVLPNAHGTAPGLRLDIPPRPELNRLTPACAILLPGPPRELRPMFLEHVMPLLRVQASRGGGFHVLTLRTSGIGESVAEEKICGPLASLVSQGLEIGYCARVGEVDIRLLTHGRTAREIVAAAEAIVRSILGTNVFGENEATLESAVVELLSERHASLVVAESCTGGMIAHRITNVPGSSNVFYGALVTYSNDAKQKWLSVQGATLATYGAVSEPVAREMAEGARAKAGVDYAIAVTGIAGPGGGTEAKPVGTVFIALAGPKGTQILNPINAFDRETFKFVTSQQALDLLRRALMEA